MTLRIENQEQVDRTVPVSKSGVPAYKRIYSATRDRITAGELRPGDPVPSERALAGEFNVSLMTARQSLNALESDGWVVRRPGVGTFVAPPRIHFNRLRGFSEQMAIKGLLARSQVLEMVSITDEEISARLQLPADSLLLRIERLRFGNAEPLAVELVYLPEEAFPSIAKEPLQHRSLFHLIEDKYNKQILYADEEIDVTPSDTHTARLLKVQLGSRVIRIRQLLWVAGSRPGAYSIGLYHPDWHSLTIRRYR
jgi:GntR family transcriptional regulator